MHSIVSVEARGEIYNQSEAAKIYLGFSCLLSDLFFVVDAGLLLNGHPVCVPRGLCLNRESLYSPFSA